MNESGAMCASEILKNVNVSGTLGDFDVCLFVWIFVARDV
jgi:hypothetical protein